MKKILTFGVFDYFHLGHLRLFKQCKKYADYLIVAVQEEEWVLKYKPSAKMLYTTEERIEIIQSLSVVDEVCVYETVSVQTIEKIDFDILALGEDHTGKRFDEVEEWCKRNNKMVVRLKRTEGISSSMIKGRVVDDLSMKHD